MSAFAIELDTEQLALLQRWRRIIDHAQGSGLLTGVLVTDAQITLYFEMSAEDVARPGAPFIVQQSLALSWLEVAHSVIETWPERIDRIVGELLVEANEPR